jgi:DNA-binding beta-propeller fold protein YncE
MTDVTQSSGHALAASAATAPDDVKRTKRARVLAIVRRKAEEGCGDCAAEYAKVARAYGASESEIGAALTAPPAAGRTISRRALFRAGGALAGSLAATAALGRVAPALGAANGSRADTVVLLGHGPSGNYVVGLDGAGNATLQSESARPAQYFARAQGWVSVRSIADTGRGGALVTVQPDMQSAPHQFEASPLGLVSTDGFDHISAALAGDGQLLFVAHQLYEREALPGVRGKGPDSRPALLGSVFRTVLEVIDVAAGQPIALVDLPSTGVEHELGIEVVAAGSGRVIVFVRQLSADDVAYDVRSTAGNWALAGTAPGTVSGSPLASATAGQTTRSAVRADGSLVRYSQAHGQIVVTDVDALLHTSVGSVRGLALGARSARHAAAFSPDATRLYLFTPARGILRVFDTHTGAELLVQRLPGPASEVTATEGGGGLPQSIALSPDGGVAYLADDRASGGGVWVTDLASGRITDHWMPGAHASAIAVGHRGKGIFLLDRLQDVVRVVDQSGGLQSVSTPGRNLLAFI